MDLLGDWNVANLGDLLVKGVSSITEVVDLIGESRDFYALGETKSGGGFCL